MGQSWAESPDIYELSGTGDPPRSTRGASAEARHRGPARRACTWPSAHLADRCAGLSPLFLGGSRPPPPSCGFGVLGPACTAQGECSERLTGRRFGKRVFKKRVLSCPWLSSLPPPGCPLPRTPGPPPGWSPFRALEHEMGASSPGVSPVGGPCPALRRTFSRKHRLLFSRRTGRPAGGPPLPRVPAFLKEALLREWGWGVNLSLAGAPLTCGSASGPYLNVCPETVQIWRPN